MNKQAWMALAEVIDALRIFPRLFISVYIFLVIYSGWWIYHLPEITALANALVLGILGVGAAWFGLYVHTGKNWRNDK